MKMYISNLLVHIFAKKIIRDTYLGVFARYPDVNGLEVYSNALRNKLGLAGLLTELINSSEHWKRILDIHSHDVIRALFQGLLGREPEPQALQHYGAKLKENGDLYLLLKEVAESEEHWKKSLGAHADELVQALFQGLLGRAAESSALQNYSAKLNEGQNLKALIEAIARSKEHENYVWKKNWRSRCDSLFTAFLGRVPNSEEITLWNNVRNICGHEEHFQLITKSLMISLLKNHSKSISVTPDSHRFNILFVYGEKKEKDSLFPLFDYFQEKKSPFKYVKILDTLSAVDDYIEHCNEQYIFVTAIEGCHRKLKAVGLAGIFVYMEHGVAPLKSYTYASHYKVFDYSLLPGKLWCERLELIYPELGKDRLFAVGYPKLAVEKINDQQKLTYQNRFNLDPNKKIILFAPTWSGGNLELGISNIRYFKDVENLIAIPHDGDVVIARGLKENGLPVHILENGESISEHYAYADILVTDISSTAIEFARLGKPVICIKTPSYPDFDLKFLDSDGVPRIPHTNYKWDFCPVVERTKISVEIQTMVSDIEDGRLVSDVPSLVKEMCAYYGEEAVFQCATAIEQIIEVNLAQRNN